ncbi:predicted protein [Lichtheimia corymbifera JMRC:FSU:9682]|uniref:SigF-like NTF2-like domain-containing protein n=1 Tax=Lichtheimia corymbifera JMRC:FSU:9682 TaxID=1263082 RepID=A0A068RGV4_9FUNG|nr:predicted protein [Lichtheimia corymbifera JMRC:FSU:9682]
MTEVETERTHFDMSSNDLIRNIVEDLFSYSSLRWERILQYYFFEDVILTTPILSTEGVNNVHFVYTLCQALNRQAPTIENIVFDTRRTAVVHLTLNVSPCVLPSFLRLRIPVVTTLHFRKTEPESGLLKIYHQEDSWTLEGLLQSLPLISFWYTHIFRVVMGLLMTTLGDLLDSALGHAQKMSARSREIQRQSRDLALELDEYRANLHENYLDRIRSWRQEQHTTHHGNNFDTFLLYPPRDDGPSRYQPQ